VQPQAQSQAGAGAVGDHIAVEDADRRDWLPGQLSKQDGSTGRRVTRRRSETMNGVAVASLGDDGANARLAGRIRD
jgi:hypothetical protein